MFYTFMPIETSEEVIFLGNNQENSKCKHIFMNSLKTQTQECNAIYS